MVQGLGAANDNAFKISLSLFLLTHLPDEAAQIRFASLAQFLFPLPFLVFSPLAGFLADRFGKARMIFYTKLPEILAMALAIVAFGAGSPAFLLAVLFLMALQSAFFSPVKYALLPESLEPRNLSMGNGILQMTTNLAILVGTAVGVLIYDRFSARPEWTGAILFGTACVGTVFALYVPLTPPGNPRARFEVNPLRSFRDNWAEARRDDALFQSLLGIAFFWLLGSLFLTLIPIFARNVLGMTIRDSGLLLMVLSVGIAAGSLLAGRLSRGRVELGLVPLGSLGLTVFILDLAIAGSSGWRWGGLPVRAGCDLILLGLSAGLFIVPLNALLQQRSPEGGKGRMIAFSNVLTFSAVLLAAAIPWLTSELLGWGTRQILLASGLLTAGVTVYIVFLLPDFLVRLVLWLLTNTVYRIRVEGEGNLPAGGGLLVANHVSWVDALLIGASCDRRIRFLMFRPLYELRPFNGFFRRMNVIPVSNLDSARQKEASLAQAREEIRQGHLVCIFAEGSITRTGNLLRFRRGLERIAAGNTAPIVPVLLDGVWGSIFSYRGNRPLFRWPRRVLAPVRVVFGRPLASSSSAFEVRQSIQELSVTAFAQRKAAQRPLQIQFLRRAKRHWRRLFVIDSSGRRLRYGQALVRTLQLRRRLFGRAGREDRPVGILLPTGIEAALVNLAALAGGRSVLNLDQEAPVREIEDRLSRAGVDLVVTSREITARLRGAGFAPSSEAIRIVAFEDLARSGGTIERCLLWSICRFGPVTVLARSKLFGGGLDVDSTAALIEADLRPSDGPPRTVGLSHHNILSNIDSLRQVFRLDPQDRILGVLPFSSAFGLTHTLFLPAVTGVSVVYHSDPGEGATIGRLAETHRASLLPVAPVHLDDYCHSVKASQFATLRYVVTSGEGLTPELRDRVASRFGIEPLASFGCAECSPLISLNVPSGTHGRTDQPGQARGTSGHPLPGVAVRIVDRRTGETLPPNRPGLLRVKGPSVMRGYFGDEAATARVMRNGWLDLRRFAVLDANGFLTVRN